MRNNEARKIALGGLMAAVAMVIMCLVGLIPVATFVCPVLCMILLCVVLRVCGRRIGWAWYGALAVLCLLMAPDKEAALVFLFIGYYPLVKPLLERYKLRWVYKLLLFNFSILLLYGATIRLFGMEQLLNEYAQMGKWLTVTTLALGNITFVLLDICLTRFSGMGKRK